MKIFKILLITWLLTLFCTPVFSQNSTIDSLFAELKKPVADTTKISLLNDIAMQYENDPAKMMEYVKKALLLSQHKNLKQQQADAWFNIGNANIMLSHYTQALKSYTNAQALFEQLLKKVSKSKINDIKDRLAITYGSIGVVCSEQNNYAKALEYYFKALKLHEETKEEEYMAHTYNNIGIVYKEQKEYGKALEYYNKALWLQKKLDDQTSAITITNIGAIYLLRNEHDKALESFNEAEKILKTFADKRALGELHNNYGNYYVKISDYEQAKKSYLLALSIFEKMGEKYGASASLGYLGAVYASHGNDNEAVKYLQKSSALAEEIGVLEQLKESEKKLSEIYEKTGNTAEALKHYKRYSAAKEKINSAESIKSIVREEMNYEFERKEALLKIENEKRQLMFDEQAKRHRLQIVFISLFILLLFGITTNICYAGLFLMETSPLVEYSYFDEDKNATIIDIVTINYDICKSKNNTILHDQSKNTWVYDYNI